jgi:hypothetical protein
VFVSQAFFQASVPLVGLAESCLVGGRLGGSSLACRVWPLKPVAGTCFLPQVLSWCVQLLCQSLEWWAALVRGRLQIMMARQRRQLERWAALVRGRLQIMMARQRRQHGPLLGVCVQWRWAESLAGSGSWLAG